MTEFKRGAAIGVLGYFIVNAIGGITGSFTPILVIGVAAYLFFS